MKTYPNYPHRNRDTGALLRNLLVATIILALIMALTSCTVTTSPDGTQTTQPDYNAWLEITRLVLTDEIPKAAIVPTK